MDHSHSGATLISRSCPGPGSPAAKPNPTILVTGGCGYIGTHTVVELLVRDFDIVIVDDLSNSTTESTRRAEQITGRKVAGLYNLSVCDAVGLRRIFAQHQISAVIHFAGLKSIGESNTNPLLYYHANVTGMITLLSVMAEFEVFNFVFSSSATVYGHPQQLPVPESHPVSPTNPYGRTKLMCEDIAKDLANADPRFKVALLRYFNPIGAHESGLIGEDPNGTPNNLLPFITQVLVGRLTHLRVLGNDYDTPDGTGVRDFVHIVDLAIGHVAALQYLQAQTTDPDERKQNCWIWNMGTGKGCSVLDVVHAMERVAGKTVPILVAPRRPGDCGEVVADVSKANHDLGWEATRSIDDMVQSAWRFQKEHPQGYSTKPSNEIRKPSVLVRSSTTQTQTDEGYGGSTTDTDSSLRSVQMRSRAPMPLGVTLKPRLPVRAHTVGGDETADSADDEGLGAPVKIKGRRKSGRAKRIFGAAFSALAGLGHRRRESNDLATHAQDS